MQNTYEILLLIGAGVFAGFVNTIAGGGSLLTLPLLIFMGLPPAIANGTNRLRNSNVDGKVMILLSDGSNNSGEIDPITAAELAAQFNIKIYTIGAGTNQSYTRIPGRGLIRNEIDEETLIQIAKVTGGRYFRATDIAALESIYSEISSLERSEIEVNEYTQYTELYGWFLIPAFILGMGMEVTRRSIFRMIT